MTEPGLYRHYKGHVYRVLFIAPWWGVERTVELNDAIDVRFSHGDVGVVPVLVDSVGTRLLSALWSENAASAPAYDTDIVIYVALYGTGRISARTAREFEERVDAGPPEQRYCRFTRIGP